MCDTPRQEVLNSRSGDNRTFLPGRQGHVVCCVSNLGREYQRHNTLSDTGTFLCWVPKTSFGNVTWGAVPFQDGVNAQFVIHKTTERCCNGVHQYQRQTKAECQHCVENIELTTTDKSPLFFLSPETAKIAVTSLISLFPIYLVGK